MDVELNLTTEPVEYAQPTKPIVVEGSVSIRTAMELMKEHQTGCLTVCRDNRLAGIFTERDALRLMSSGDSLDSPVESIMAPDPVTVRSGESIASAIHKMSTGGYRRLPIVDKEGVPQGLLQVAGIVHYLAEHFPKTVYNLPPALHAVPMEREGP